MRTTLNLPDPIVLRAKRKALEEGTTLTELIVQGLEARLEQDSFHGDLPVSVSKGGLRGGVSWERLQDAAVEDEGWR